MAQTEKYKFKLNNKRILTTCKKIKYNKAVKWFKTMQIN